MRTYKFEVFCSLFSVTSPDCSEYETLRYKIILGAKDLTESDIRQNFAESFADAEQVSDLKRHLEKKNKILEDTTTEQALKITRLETKLASLEGTVQEIKEFQKGMKHYQKGGLVVTYHTSTGFLPRELEEFSDEVLAQRQKDLEKKTEEISKLLKKRN